MALDETELRALAAASSERADLWARFGNAVGARSVAEFGVYRGRFASRLLRECPAIDTYWMIDPWRHLDDWNKPLNQDSDRFERVFEDAMSHTEDFADKRKVLRGRTSEVVDEIPDGSLDFAYVDGDHTLRGITIDLVRVLPKLRDGGWLGGDDLKRSIWQHGDDYEPTLVFPWSVYFAEAVGARFYALPYDQFLIENSSAGDFAFVDLTGRYGDRTLRGQLRPPVPPVPPVPPAAAPGGSVRRRAAGAIRRADAAWRRRRP